MNDFTFADIFSLSMSPLQVIVTLLMALVVGGFICFVYKKTFGGVMYSRYFNLSLIVLTMVTALMLMLINNSLALSLGMAFATISISRVASKNVLSSTVRVKAKCGREDTQSRCSETGAFDRYGTPLVG